MVVYEMLEARRMMSTAPMGVTATGTLWVQGTSGDDVIAVTSSGSTITVGINALQGFDFTGVHRIWIEGAAGNDRIVYRGAANMPVRLLGCRGRDTLRGEGPRVTLSGGEGNDDLYADGAAGVFLAGGRGGEGFFGGAGNDTLFGGAGDDYASNLRPGDVQGDMIERISAVAH